MLKFYILIIVPKDILKIESNSTYFSQIALEQCLHCTHSKCFLKLKNIKACQSVYKFNAIVIY